MWVLTLLPPLTHDSEFRRFGPKADIADLVGLPEFEGALTTVDILDGGDRCKTSVGKVSVLDLRYRRNYE